MRDIFAAVKHEFAILCITNNDKLHLQQAAFCDCEYSGYPADHKSW